MQSKQAKAHFIVLTVVVIAVLAVHFLVSKNEDPPAAPEPLSFSAHWYRAVQNMVTLREQAVEEKTAGTEKLCAEIRSDLKSMPGQVRAVWEQDMLTLTAGLGRQLEEQLSGCEKAAQESDQKKLKAATQEIGFILEEMARLTELAGL